MWRHWGGPFKSVTIDATKALGNISGPSLKTQVVTGISHIVGAKVVVYTGMSEEQDGLCNAATGRYILEFDVFLNDSGQLHSVQPSTYSAPQSIVDIYNTGSVATCTVVTTMENVNDVSMSGLEADYESCTAAPGNFDGFWKGTYSCGPTCPEADDVEFTITQNGGTATYFDGSANYSGFICGDIFSFRGGNAAYDESGKMVISASNSNSATKTSFYKSLTGDNCSASCTDDLTRQ